MEKACKCRTVKVHSSSSKSATYVCKCGETRIEVPLTKKQNKEFMAGLAGFTKSSKKGGIHHLYHTFNDKLGIGQCPTTYPSNGYEFMCEIGKFAKKHPEIVECVVDDDAHAGSRIYLIPHKDNDSYWGTTCLYVPQCTGENPIRFFLYPEHLNELIAGLQAMKKQAAAFRGKKPKSSFDSLKPMTIQEAKKKAIKEIAKDVVKPKPKKAKSRR